MKEKIKFSYVSTIFGGLDNPYLTRSEERVCVVLDNFESRIERLEKEIQEISQKIVTNQT